MIPILAFIAGMYYAEQVIRANVSKTDFEEQSYEDRRVPNKGRRR